MGTRGPYGGYSARDKQGAFYIDTDYKNWLRALPPSDQVEELELLEYDVGRHYHPDGFLNRPSPSFVELFNSRPPYNVRTHPPKNYR